LQPGEVLRLSSPRGLRVKQNDFRYKLFSGIVPGEKIGELKTQRS
jgi:hypothetical protein